MLDRLAEGFVPNGGSSGTFGKPQHFSVADSTSTSIELIWQPIAVAKFNIYRSRSRTKNYTKITPSPVSGASFADRELKPATTYYYKIHAVNGSNQVSAAKGPVHRKTASSPPACDPYYSNNPTHVLMHRALPDLFGNAWTVKDGILAGELIGKDDTDHSSHLTKDNTPLPTYHVRYCP